MKVFGIVLLIAAAFLCSGLNTEYEKKEVHYTVQPGDTLWYIAGKYFNQQDKENHFGTFQWTIKEANEEKFADDRWLKPGDVLIIPLERRVDK